MIWCPKCGSGNTANTSIHAGEDANDSGIKVFAGWGVSVVVILVLTILTGGIVIPIWLVILAWMAIAKVALPDEDAAAPKPSYKCLHCYHTWD